MSSRLTKSRTVKSDNQQQKLMVPRTEKRKAWRPYQQKYMETAAVTRELEDAPACTDRFPGRDNQVT
ncbi:hypothetical protein Nans01_23410 [Nocardiopsis ansamitocini]|uniref:Uncharacterized protein n=1 Tax=Nocardiopsis ansamitocini TaxID=1670832 RepID=A0A9W6UJF0_9ACTN|nr:hypothetical protein Nans01_23410 [Nocardiopsis ansamitocini]